MAFVAVSRDGHELIFDDKPEYDRIEDCWRTNDGEEIVYNDFADFSAGVHREDRFFYGIELPKGTIKKMIGKELTFNDDPMGLKE